MLKRSFLSIRRKLGHTIILVLIFFVMANLVLAAITIKSAVNAQMDYAKSTLGGTVSLQADMSAIRKNQRAQVDAGGDPREMFGKIARPQVAVETANEIASLTEYVKDYSYSVSANANSAELSTVESSGGGFPGKMGGPGRGASSDESTLNADITVNGVNAYAYISAVQNESMEIKDGTYFDEDSDDGAMISYEFAELNDLKVGAKFTLQNIYTEENVELTVIGIYDTAESRADANTIYLNTATAAKFLSEDDYNDGNYAVDDVNFYMVTSERAEEFVEKINAEFPELAEENLKVAVDTSEYDALSGSVESVGSFATTILVIVVIAAVVIITLIVTINVRDRRYEMGVLLSLGASKRNVLGQIATELIVVGTIGFALAGASGNFLAQAMGQGILESQTAASAQMQEKNFGRPGARSGGGEAMSGASGSSAAGGASSTDDAGGEGGSGVVGGAGVADRAGSAGGAGSASGANGAGVAPDGKTNMKAVMAAGRGAEAVELDISASLIDYLLLFVVGYIVILLALILPAVNIMRYQPKEILTGKE